MTPPWICFIAANSDAEQACQTTTAPLAHLDLQLTYQTEIEACPPRDVKQQSLAVLLGLCAAALLAITRGASHAGAFKRSMTW